MLQLRNVPNPIPETQLAAALSSSDPQALRNLPKSDLHCHGLLNAPLAAFEGILGHGLPKPPVRFRDFGEFGGYLSANLFPALRDVTSVRTLLWAGLERMVADGVVYTEVSIDLLLPEHLQVAPEAVVEMVGEVKADLAPRLHFAPEIGINRRMRAERLRPAFDVFLDSEIFESLDLYDDERAGDLNDVLTFYRQARTQGLRLKAHAGEICGPERIWQTLNVLDVDAIQHGIAAVNDPALLDELARRGTQLNLALASNICLGIAGSYENHPIHRLVAAGVPVALGTDDFTIFGSSLSDEIRRLYRMGMRLSDLAKLRLGPP